MAVPTARLDFPHSDIDLYVTSEPERRWRSRACAKEPWTVEWLIQDIGPGEVLYDIGANVGTFSLIAAKHCGAMVVAFEPGYATFARLCDNIHLNGLDRAVVPVPLPLAERTGIVGFKYRTLDPGQSRHRLYDEAWSGDTGSRQVARYIQPTLAITLDALRAQFQLPAPHHLKIDVDGAEPRVLAGAAETLREPDLRTILIEVDDEHWASVDETLRGSGFGLRVRHRREEKPGAPCYAVFER
ncbi:MAG: FkbM family methyltransferase [Vicinamibacterales bacterium]